MDVTGEHLNMNTQTDDIKDRKNEQAMCRIDRKIEAEKNTLVINKKEERRKFNVRGDIPYIGFKSCSEDVSIFFSHSNLSWTVPIAIATSIWYLVWVVLNKNKNFALPFRYHKFMLN